MHDAKYHRQYLHAARCVFSRALRYHAASLMRGQSSKEWDVGDDQGEVYDRYSRQVQKHHTYNVTYVRVSILDRNESVYIICSGLRAGLLYPLL